MATDPASSIRSLQRFGFGPRPGDLARIGDGVRDLLRAEVADRTLTALSGLPYASMAEAGPALRDFTEAERKAREARAQNQPPTAAVPATAPNAAPSLMGGGMAANAVAPAPMGAPSMPAPVMGPPAPPEMPVPQRSYREEVRARFHAALDPIVGFGDRLAMFWANHFAVSVNKDNNVRTFAGLMEREAIRPHVFGRFADMLLAVETHPAMIFFLDNQQSIGPNSRAGQRRGRGLNENLAREILELHTLGVAGGYTQADVTALAKIITGWGVAGRDSINEPPGTFQFNPNTHEPGPHVVLGKTYPDGGFARGQDALRDLARHPSTAQHIARKLVRHFVADEPPASLVARLAHVFRDTDGDLQQVSRALIEAPEAWAQPAAKLRTPQEFLIAASRALQRKPEIGQIMGPLNAMGQPMWMPGGPNGFPDTAAAWASPEGIKTRLDVASAIARQSASGVEPRTLVDEIFGPSLSTETRQAVLRAESRYQAVALALMAPEFQRR
jgi:uncharacterized protein (DUF1800 family)